MIQVSNACKLSQRVGSSTHYPAGRSVKINHTHFQKSQITGGRWLEYSDWQGARVAVAWVGALRSHLPSWSQWPGPVRNNCVYIIKNKSIELHNNELIREGKKRGSIRHRRRPVLEALWHWRVMVVIAVRNGELSGHFGDYIYRVIWSSKPNWSTICDRGFVHGCRRAW